jgi:hypothetical protein
MRACDHTSQFFFVFFLRFYKPSHASHCPWAPADLNIRYKQAALEMMLSFVQNASDLNMLVWVTVVLTSWLCGH